VATAGDLGPDLGQWVVEEERAEVRATRHAGAGGLSLRLWTKKFQGMFGARSDGFVNQCACMLRLQMPQNFPF